MDGVGDVIFKHRGHIFLRLLACGQTTTNTYNSQCVEIYSSHSTTYLWKITLTVADEQTSLATTSITDDHQLLRIGRRLREVGRGRHGARRGAVGGANGAVAGASALSPTGEVTRWCTL